MASCASTLPSARAFDVNPESMSDIEQAYARCGRNCLDQGPVMFYELKVHRLEQHGSSSEHSQDRLEILISVRPTSQIVMSRVKQQVYFSIVKLIVYSCLVFNLIKGLFLGFSMDRVLTDSFYLFLIMFLRSTMTAPVWRVGLKWTILVCIPIEAIYYGGGLLAFLVASMSVVKFLFNYGFVLYWNPVLKKKDTLPNRLIEIVISSFMLSLFSPSKLHTLLAQIVLSLHTFWMQTKIVQDVCDSGVMDDMKAVVSEIPRDTSPSRPSIELWLVAYHGASKKLNVVPQEVVDSHLSTVTPWQLRRLLIQSITVDPTRAQMKSLLTAASHHPVGANQSQPTLLAKGPLALISEEPNERVVVNEAIAGLTRLYHSLGEKRFLSAFDRSTDGKLALEIVLQGFK
jgi:hypothetical protein